MGLSAAAWPLRPAVWYSIRMSIPELPYPSPEPNSPHVPVWTPSQLKGAAKRRADRTASIEYVSLGETIANAVSNGVGAALAIAALVILVVVAVMHGGGVRLLVALAFAVPMLLAFLMSTLYHAIPAETAKVVFSVLGHSFVLLYIAGAFTPYCMLVLADSGGPLLCGVEWLLAFVGIMIEALWVGRPRWIQIGLCLVMGLAAIFVAPALAAALPPAGFGLLVAAAVCFVAGLVFYVFRSVPYLLFVSHLTVLAGSVCLFLSVVLFVI